MNGNYVHPLLNLHSTLAQVPREDITKTKSTVYQQKPFTCQKHLHSQNVNITYSGNSGNNVILPVLNDAGELQQQLTNTSLNTPDQSVQNDNTQNYPSEEIDSLEAVQPPQKCSSETYNSTTPSGENAEAITVATQMQRTTLLNSLNSGRYVSPETRRRIHNAIEALANEGSNNAFICENFPELSNLSNLGVPAQQTNNVYSESCLNNAAQRTLEAVNNTIEDDTDPSAEAMYTETIRAQTNPGPGMTTNNMSSYSQVTCLRNPTIPVSNKSSESSYR